MATKTYTGAAAPRAQVTHVTVAVPEEGDTFTLTINRKSISVTAGANATLESVITQFVSAIGQYDNDVAEWAEVSASVGRDAGQNAAYLILTGLTDGTPFTVTATESSAAAFAITVTVVQEAIAKLTPKMRVTLNGAGGGFTLTCPYGTTAILAHSDSAATVTTEIDTLTSSQHGGCQVTKNANGDWLIDWINSTKRVPNFTGTSTSLNGAGCSVVTEVVREGRPVNYSKGPTLTLTLTDVNSFRFKFTGGSLFTGVAHYSTVVTNGGDGVTADQIRDAIKSIMIPAGIVSDTDTDDPLPAQVAAYTLVDVIGQPGGPFTIYLRDGNLTAMTYTDALETSDVYTSPGTLGGTAEIAAEAADGTGINEMQHIIIDGGPTGGTYTLTFQGQTTAGIAYNANSATVLAALEALSNIAPGDVTISGSGTRALPFVLTFAATYAATDVARITGTSSLTGGTVFIERVQEYRAGQNEMQQIQITGGVPTGGTFTLNAGGGNTGNIDWDATAAEIETAIIATLGAGDVEVTGGPFPEVPVVVEFKNTYAEANVALITGNAGSLTSSDTQTLTVETNTTDPTGPEWWDEPLNWSGGTLPANTDICWLDKYDGNILYGLDGVTAEMAELHITASFTGQFGLKPISDAGYYQYRQLSADVKATLLMVGEGSGDGSPFINLNGGTFQTQLIVNSTGSPDDNSIPALMWKGTHNSNVVRVFRGSFGCALLVGETATIATLQIGYATDREGDVEYAIGPGITVTTIQISGGDGVINLGTANATTLTITGGQVVVNGTYGVSTTFAIAPDNDDVNATVVWNTTGTLGGAPVVAGAGKLDFSQDMRAKTVTNPIEVNSPDAIVDDPFQAVSNLRLDFNYCAAEVNSCRLGNNVRVTRATPS